MSNKNRNLRVKRVAAEEEVDNDVEELHRDKLEDIKLLQRQRKRIGGLDASSLGKGPGSSTADALAGGGQSDLMETYVRAKPIDGAISVPDEDPNMRKYVEEQVAQRIGKRHVDEGHEDQPEARRQRQENELYVVPDKYKNALSHQEVVIPGLITGITEVVLPTDVRLKNIEDTEAAKRRLLAATSSGAHVEEDMRGRRHIDTSMRRGLFPSSFGHAGEHKKKDKLEPSKESQHRKYVKDPNYRHTS